MAVACLVSAPYIGQKLGWTVPNRDRADYIIRAQATLITVTGMVLAFSLVQAQGNIRQTEELVAKEASTMNTLDHSFSATVIRALPYGRSSGPTQRRSSRTNGPRYETARAVR